MMFNSLEFLSASEMIIADMIIYISGVMCQTHRSASAMLEDIMYSNSVSINEQVRVPIIEVPNINMYYRSIFILAHRHPHRYRHLRRCQVTQPSPSGLDNGSHHSPAHTKPDRLCRPAR